MSRLTDEELFEVYSKAYDAKGDVVREEAVFGYAGLRAVADAAVAADRASRGEPFAYCFTDVNGRAKEFCDSPECAHPHDKRIITPLYTRPLPDATQEEPTT